MRVLKPVFGIGIDMQLISVAMRSNTRTQKWKIPGNLIIRLPDLTASGILFESSGQNRFVLTQREQSARHHRNEQQTDSEFHRCQTDSTQERDRNARGQRQCQ